MKNNLKAFGHDFSWRRLKLSYNLQKKNVKMLLKQIVKKKQEKKRNKKQFYKQLKNYEKKVQFK